MTTSTKSRSSRSAKKATAAPAAEVTEGDATAEVESTETDATEQKVEAERLCPKCGRGGLPPKYRVHDECLSTPTAARRRERVLEAGKEQLRLNQHAKFERQLATVSDAQLDVWEDRAADAHNSRDPEVEKEWIEAGKAGQRKILAHEVASIVIETVDDPGTAKKTA